MSKVFSEVAQYSTNVVPTQHTQSFLLGSRHIDFLMLGGLAILVWIPLFFLQDLWSPVKSLGLAIPGMAVMLAYAVNHPHFMASYKLAYTQGQGFVSSNWIQLVLVPVVLVMAMAIGYIYSDVSISDSTFVHSINAIFQSIGLETRLGRYPNLGSETMGFLIIFMYFTVGWHYSKQVFGCMMVYGKLDNYVLSPLHRNLIRYSLLSTWWVTWLYGNCSVGTYPFYNLTIHRLGLPYVLFQIAYVIVGLMFAAVVAMFVVKYVNEKQRPSANFLVPMIALLLWHVPLFGNPEYFIIIALFHSLQYFPFVAKVELARYRKGVNPKPYKRILMFYAIMIGIGYLAFETIPYYLDRSADTVNGVGISYFIIGFLIFINVHHYFIDNVLWRFKNKEVRELLFDNLAGPKKA